MSDKVDQMVVDEFRRDSFLLDKLTFDDAVSAGTGGSTMTYGYVQLLTPSTASTRAINAEYVANEAKRVKKTADLDIFGGAFEIDRVIQNTSGAIDEVEFQLKEKIKATANEFHNAVINGSANGGSGYVKTEFDGIRKLVAGSSTESKVTIDLSTSANIKQNADEALLALFDWLSTFAEKPDMLMMNGKMIARIKDLARVAGYYSRGEGAFGQTVEMFDNIPLIDAGRYFNGTKEVDVVETVTKTGVSSIVGVKLGLNGFHGISPTEKSAIIKTYLPDFNAPGAVKRGEAELVAGVVLKNSKMAGILDGLQILPASASSAS